ncbi:FAD-binding oxidoreductase [Sphaerisporangium corydalis]|uniref:FAD-binding oxidoreductase n=1 Tax=Sphaerisporangium corydalis TaxID=1441875 RepID=UPI0021CFF2F6|nr:FAD-binding oxidoreductase [Sphaerisporangium corydalis]
MTIREAGSDDAVAGVTPRWVALPESTEEVAAVMRAAAEHDLAVVTAGSGTKLHWGPPPTRCDLMVDTCCLNEILEHVAGDLVVRVQAGVTVEALAAALAGAGQQLALDVPIEGATIGGTLATATAGPRRLRYGTARDLLIGITVVLADGTIARSGGKVVKNVAGYDLGKLFTGSQGTLGVITEATFRLHPLPAARAWVTATVPDLAGLPGLAAVAASQLEPSALEVDRPGPRAPLTVTALIEGVAADERAKATADLMGPTATITPTPPNWWSHLPTDHPTPPGTNLPPEPQIAASPDLPLAHRVPPGTDPERQAPPGTNPPPEAPVPLGEEAPPLEPRVPSEPHVADGEGFLMELRVPPGAVVRAFAAVGRAAEEAGGIAVHVRGSLASAVLHLALPPDTTAPAAETFVAALRSGVAADGGRLVVWTAPPDAAARLDRWGPVGAASLMRRVRERFDPEGRMSPGRLDVGPPPAANHGA